MPTEMSPAEDATSRLRSAVTAAMKRRDQAATAGLRSALSALGNAESLPVEDSAVPGPATTSEHIAGTAARLGAAEAERRVLTTAEIDAVLRAEVDDRERAAEDLDALGHGERAQRLRAEAAAVRDHLGG